MTELENKKFTKWVACWGNATSITDRKEAVYAKNLTLRYPIKICFSGNKLRFHFSNFTGTESVFFSKIFIAKKSDDSDSQRNLKKSEENLQNSFKYSPKAVTFLGNSTVSINPGEEICSDEIPFDITAGETIEVSIYLENYTQMNAGTLITGPLSSGKYSYGDFAASEELPLNVTRNTNWFYFLNTIDIFTEEKNHALICYGDSITAQSWPDYLAIRAWNNGFKEVSIIRRAVSGTRILRQYNCITYQAYGLKGSIRFPLEMNVAGAETVIIQHGINDIIHPVGVEVNPFRPWSDMPCSEDLIKGVEEIYLSYAKSLGLKIWSGTLLPIFGWRTYTRERDKIRNEFNQWLRTSDKFDGCVDFDKAVRDSEKPECFAPGFDSGDHLHPSEKAYQKMAEWVPEKLLKTNSILLK